MADNTSWEADLDAALEASADTEELDSEEPTSPETDTAPPEADPEPADEPPADDQDETESTDESVETVVAEPEAVKPNWDTEDNPHYQKSKQLEQVQAQARMLVEQAAQKRAAELQAERIRALSDDDPARVVEIQQLVQDAQRPVLEQAQRLEGETEFAAKLATVAEAVAGQFLTPEKHTAYLAEVERLMALPGGPQYLQQDLAVRKAHRDQLETDRAADRQKIAELERRLAAQSVLDERRKNGADVVDSNTGVGKGFQARYDAASGEEALDVILEDLYR